MYTILTITIGFLILSILLTIGDGESIIKKIGFFFKITILGFLVSVAVALLLDMFFAKTEVRQTQTYHLMTLKDNNTTNGRFFLGSGTINGKMVFSFYYKTDNGSMKFEQIDARNAEIFYSDEIKIETFETFTLPNNWHLTFNDRTLDPPTYKVYVPEGTIKEEFKLDAE